MSRRRGNGFRCGMKEPMLSGDGGGCQGMAWRAPGGARGLLLCLPVIFSLDWLVLGRRINMLMEE